MGRAFESLQPGRIAAFALKHEPTGDLLISGLLRDGECVRNSHVMTGTSIRARARADDEHLIRLLARHEFEAFASSLSPHAGGNTVWLHRTLDKPGQGITKLLVSGKLEHSSHFLNTRRDNTDWL